ncbi:Phosphatidylinositol 3,4,5-trisphosphate 3-phosphatase and dual-specificity protein phosphatase PTEN [Penicillium rolfsii]|nr:Phosphatidylinositol 3,4,5-trisphosphate 3-phosphatase and dual-specificity protein phosphatase PTEN [Penicillium rolfsii]
MTSILRQIIAGPRLQHPEAGLDLCYVTDNIIATSGPSATYPQRAYRNPLDELVKFLDAKHGENWCIWEFRAEGTGYPDSEVYNRIHHFPWPDHHPPPFALIPNIVGSMRNWLHRLDVMDGNGDKSASTGAGEKEGQKRVAVVHCKAGKGRSGTIAVSYLISQEGWKKEDALQRFTDRRMRVGFGNGVSIPSQLRYVGYVDRWANQLGKRYVERPVEILEIHLWGLRDGVKVAVEGYVDEGKKIKCFHMFHRKERTVVEAGNSDSNITPTSSSTSMPLKDQPTTKSDSSALPTNTSANLASQSDSSSSASEVSRLTKTASNLSAVIFRPNKPIHLPNSDVNIDFERRSKASYAGFAMVTSVAHVWFNAFFEGGAEHDSGIFETEWDAMDGIKGSARKGIRAFEKLKVVWRYPTEQQSAIGRPISEPKPGQPVHEGVPADWQGKKNDDGVTESVEKTEKQENAPLSTGQDVSRADLDSDSRTGSKTTGSTLLAVGAGSLHELERQLGLRRQTDESKDVSLAGSDDEARERVDQEGRAQKRKENGDLEGVQSYFKNGEGHKEP